MSGLEQEFPGRVTASNVNAETQQAKEQISQLGFHNHGLVIRSSKGTVLWKQPDHEVNVADVRAKLKELLE